MTVFDELVATFDAQGRSRYGQWDTGGYQTLVNEGAKRVWRRLLREKPEVSKQVLQTYLSLGLEVVDQGAIHARGFSGFLGGLWLELVPARAGQVPAEKLADLLVNLWNLGDGLAHELPWLDALIGSQMDAFESLPEVESTLRRVVEELFADDAVPQWTDLYTEVVELRPFADAFIPGAMHLLAPRVVCVHDRRHPGECLSLRLGGEEPQVLGKVPCGPVFEDSRAAPEVDFSDESWVEVGDDGSDLPLLGQAYERLVVPAGFIVVSAVDSQCLWVVGPDV